MNFLRVRLRPMLRLVPVLALFAWTSEQSPIEPSLRDKVEQCTPGSDHEDPPDEGNSCGGVDWGIAFSVANMTSYPGDCPEGPCSLEGVLRLGLVLKGPRDDDWRQTNPKREPDLCEMWHGDKACRSHDGPTWEVDGDGEIPPDGHSDTKSDVTLSAECGGEDTVTFTATSADGTCVVSRTLTMVCTDCSCD